MALDVITEGQEFTTGSTHVEGMSMAGSAPPPKPAPSPASPAPPPSQSQASPDAGKPSAASVPREITTPAEAQAVIDKAFANPKFKEAWADTNHPDHAALVKEMTQLFRQANPEPTQESEPREVDRLAALPEREAFAGIHQPRLESGHPMLNQSDVAEYVEFVIDEHLAPETAQNLMSDYTTRMIASGGRGLTAADFAELRGKYAGRLTPGQMDRLQAWLEKEVYERARTQGRTHEGTTT